MSGQKPRAYDSFCELFPRLDTAGGLLANAAICTAASLILGLGVGIHVAPDMFR